MRSTFAALVALLAASDASAAWTGSKAFQSCIEAAGGSDPLMTDCAHEEFDREDKRLNAAYAPQMSAADDKLKEAIRVSQRAWLTYRDTTCNAEGVAAGGGTYSRLTEAECQVRLTSERVGWLKELKP